MRRATKAISLVLIGTATALLGYEAFAPPHYGDDDGADFDNGYAATQPSSGYRGSHYYPYHSRSRGFFGGSGYGSSSYSSSRGGYSSHASVTARGGFGASGHAAGHAGS